MSVVSEEVARGEVNKWLDFQQVTAETREAFVGSVELLIDAVRNGLVTINEDNTLIQKLRFEIGKEEKIRELKYKTGITVGEVQEHLRGTLAEDKYATVMAHVCAATSEPKGVIMNLNKKDWNLSDAIIVFFMV